MAPANPKSGMGAPKDSSTRPMISLNMIFIDKAVEFDDGCPADDSIGRRTPS
jgi:hypothetical protein